MAKYQKLPPAVSLKHLCVGCNMFHGINERITVIEGNFFCDRAALKLLRVTEPQLTTSEFEARISPFEGHSRLWRYDPPPANGGAS